MHGSIIPPPFCKFSDSVNFDSDSGRFGRLCAAMKLNAWFPEQGPDDYREGQGSTHSSEYPTKNQPKPIIRRLTCVPDQIILMKKQLTLVSLILFSLFASASTDVMTTTVSGNWTMAGSPYKIFNNISIAPGGTLIIDPGVEVVFQGAYTFDVLGSLYATGTATKPINFYVQDTTGWSVSATTAGSWQGMTLGSASTLITDSCSVKYCNFRDMKGICVNVRNRSILFENCNFFHNNNNTTSYDAIVASAHSLTTNRTFKLWNCSIHDNIGNRAILTYYSIQDIHGCSIYNNDCTSETVVLGGSSCNFANNQVYHNTASRAVIHGFDNTVMIGNKIYENTSTNLAAVYINGSGDIISNLICNNRHISGSCGLTDGGGGLHVSSNSASTDPNRFNFVIRNNVIANNTSPYQGGGIKVEEVSGALNVTIANNDIIHNESPLGSGLYIHSLSSAITVKNNIILGETGSSPALYPIRGLCGSGSFRFENNFAEVPTAQIYSGISGGIFTGDTTGHITGATAGITDGTATSAYTDLAISKNFSLLPTSPCINKGDAAGANCYTTDYAGNTRIVGPKVDIGAYEYNPATGIIATNSANTTFNVYPNPATGVLYVTTSTTGGTITLTDLQGRKVAEQAVTSQLTQVNVSQLSQGIYFATWDNGQERLTQKIAVD